jgi:hypothetical protein
MATQFTFFLEDHPGALAEVAIVLGDAGINIDGISAAVIDKKSVIQILTNHPSDAKETLHEAGIPYLEQEVLRVKMKNKPGQIAKLAQTFADANVNMSSFYVTMNGEQIIGATPLETAKQIVKELKILPE